MIGLLKTLQKVMKTSPVKKNTIAALSFLIFILELYIYHLNSYGMYYVHACPQIYELYHSIFNLRLVESHEHKTQFVDMPVTKNMTIEMVRGYFAWKNAVLPINVGLRIGMETFDVNIFLTLDFKLRNANAMV